jgi:hypothetical protein
MNLILVASSNFENFDEQDISGVAENLVNSSDDPSDLICAEAVMHNEKTSKRKVPQLTLLKLKGISPEFIMQSLEWFCCSFVK